MTRSFINHLPKVSLVFRSFFALVLTVAVAQIGTAFNLLPKDYEAIGLLVIINAGLVTLVFDYLAFLGAGWAVVVLLNERGMVVPCGQSLSRWNRASFWVSCFCLLLTFLLANAMLIQVLLHIPVLPQGWQPNAWGILAHMGTFGVVALIATHLTVRDGRDQAMTWLENQALRTDYERRLQALPIPVFDTFCSVACKAGLIAFIPVILIGLWIAIQVGPTGADQVWMFTRFTLQFICVGIPLAMVVNALHRAVIKTYARAHGLRVILASRPGSSLALACAGRKPADSLKAVQIVAVVSLLLLVALSGTTAIAINEYRDYRERAAKVLAADNELIRGNVQKADELFRQLIGSPRLSRHVKAAQQACDKLEPMEVARVAQAKVAVERNLYGVYRAAFQGDFREAQREFQQMPSSEPRLAEAAACLDQCRVAGFIRSASGPGSADMEQGHLWLLRGDLARAGLSYRTALGADRENPLAQAGWKYCLDALHTHAQNYIQRGSLMTPSGASAMDTIQKMAAMAPGDTRIDALKGEVAAKYMGYARKAAKNNRPEAALEYLRNALKVGGDQRATRQLAQDLGIKVDSLDDPDSVRQR